jgi:Cupin domain
VAHAGEEIRNAAAGLTLRLLQTGADTDGQLLEMEATYEPSSIDPVEHFHPRQDEHFEVLEGTLRAEIDGELRELRAGDVLDVPAGTTQGCGMSSAPPSPHSPCRRSCSRSSRRSEGCLDTGPRLIRPVR